MAKLWFAKAMRGIALFLFVTLGLRTLVSVFSTLAPIFGIQMPFFTSDTLFTAAVACGILYQVCRMQEERA